MQKQFFNTIPSEGGEVAILLYGDVGDGQRVDSARVVAELMALQAQYDKIDVRINSCWKSHTNLTHPSKYFRPSKTIYY